MEPGGCYVKQQHCESYSSYKIKNFLYASGEGDAAAHREPPREIDVSEGSCSPYGVGWKVCPDDRDPALIQHQSVEKGFSLATRFSSLFSLQHGESLSF